MTLAIAKKLNNDILMYSDMKITNDSDCKANGFDGRIKTIIVNPKMCISYAGNADRALVTMESLFYLSDEGKDTDYLIKYLLNRHIEGNNETEYLVGIDSNGKKLYRIRNGVLEEGSIFWIGDIDAFSKYQEYYLSNIRYVYNDQTVSNLIGQCFDKVAEDYSVPSVESPTVYTTVEEDGFNYGCKVFMNAPNQTIHLEKNEWKSIDFGDAAKGGFGYASIVPKTPGHSCYGLKFFQGKVAYIFNYRISTEPLVVKYTSNLDLIESIKSIWDVDMVCDWEYTPCSIKKNFTKYNKNREKRRKLL